MRVRGRPWSFLCASLALLCVPTLRGADADALEVRIVASDGTPVRVREVDGYFLAYPGDAEPKT